jgi:transcriptional regulator with XRE-family HTH domain
VRDTLDTQFASFLRKKRGQVPYAVFARRLGMTPSSLFRLENGQQSITLRKLQQVLSRLRCKAADVFGQINN